MDGLPPQNHHFGDESALLQDIAVKINAWAAHYHVESWGPCEQESGHGSSAIEAMLYTFKVPVSCLQLSHWTQLTHSSIDLYAKGFWAMVEWAEEHLCGQKGLLSLSFTWIYIHHSLPTQDPGSLQKGIALRFMVPPSYPNATQQMACFFGSPPMAWLLHATWVMGDHWRSSRYSQDRKAGLHFGIMSRNSMLYSSHCP